MKSHDFSNEYRNSGLFSRMFFLWTSRIISHARVNNGIDGNVKLVEMADENKTFVVCNEFEKKIDELKAKDPKFRVGDSIGWILMLTYKKQLATLTTTAFLSDATIITNLFVATYFIKWLLDPSSSSWKGYMFVLVLVLNQFFT